MRKFGLWSVVTIAGLLACRAASGQTLKKAETKGCRVEVIEGELTEGNLFTRSIGGGLRLWFEPIHSGWILRVVPAVGPIGIHDYAELATPPYRSVTPLSLSTDFSFRAQDAVGWNPRRFKFATSAKAFAKLDSAYEQLMSSGATPPAPLQVELSEEISRASDGKLTILDARLVGGTADQWRMADAVSNRFTATAHTLVDPPEGKPMALGRLLWLRFRVDLDLPVDFKAERGSKLVPHLCGSL